MMRILVFLLLLLGWSGCVKTPSEAPSPSLPNADFNWSTISSQTLTLTETSDILNAEGDTVAQNLAAGKYTIPTGMQTQLIVVPSVQSKAETSVSQMSFPSKGTYARMMAEDLFPNKGDYDMNDVVLGFRIDYVFTEAADPQSGEALVKTIKFNIIPRAIGTPTQQIGVAAHLRGAVPQINKVTGTHKTDLDQLFSYDSRFVENGSSTQSTVIPLAGNLRRQFKHPNLTGMINTFDALYDPTDNNYGIAATANVDLSTPVPFNQIELFGENNNQKLNLDLFLVIDKRSKEIHLKGQRPTSKFDYSLFGKELTDFVTPDNYVWMMVVDQEIPYPKEMASIEKAYPQFTAWVQAGGKLTYNWYDVTYRDANYMYIGKYK